MTLLLVAVVLCATCADSGAAVPPLRRLATAHLAAGSQPSVLPGPVLIADRGNNRLLMVDPHGRVVWQFPQPGDLRPGQTFISPDDAFFSENGKQIIVTQENDYVLTVVDIATQADRVPLRHPRCAGQRPKPSLEPRRRDAASGRMDPRPRHQELPPGAHPPGAHRPSRIFGTTTQVCYHAPPTHWGSPNGAFPMRNGHFLVTEINGDWVDELSLAGRVIRSWHPPGFTYPSDTNEVKPGLYLAVDYTNPGGLEMFDRQGRVRWRYEPKGADPSLQHPSLATPLPNRDVLLNDDDNDRVIVIDPRTNRVVWQYGHTGVPGHAPGYLNDPDGLDLAPPHSLLIVHAATVGHP